MRTSDVSRSEQNLRLEREAMNVPEWFLFDESELFDMLEEGCWCLGDDM